MHCDYQYTLEPKEQGHPKEIRERLIQMYVDGMEIRKRGIENDLHYCRDVTLHEDQTRFTKYSAAHVICVINNTVIGQIGMTGLQFFLSAKR